MAGDGAVGGLGLHGLAVRGQEDRGHQTQRAEALGNLVGLDVAIVVLAGPDEAAVPLQGRGDHVVDQAVLVGQARLLVLGGELGLVDLGEDVLEAPVIGLEDGVLGREIDGIVALQAVGEGGAGELPDRLVDVVHGHGDARAGVIEDLVLDLLAVLAGPLDGQLALAGDPEVRGAILVAEGVAADDDGLGPAGDQPRDIAADDGLPEDHAAEDVADRAIRRLPHLLQVEFLHPGFVRGDGRALHADAMTLDRLGGFDRDLVVGGVAVLHPQVVVVEVDIQVREDQLVFDPLPDDAGHFVPVQVHDRVGDFDLGHDGRALLGETIRLWRVYTRPCARRKGCGTGFSLRGRA